MTKVFKNILISLCGVFAFLFAGFFFVGCSVDYSKISLVADKQSIELEVGESTEIVFTIENYQSGFSNKVQVNPRSDGQTAIFSASDPVYISKDQIKITITGTAGGYGELSVSTLEGGKECSVSVYVNQYSSSMEFDDTVLYVSNKTEFVPDSSQFIFDNHTTHKELSYYYLETKSDINFNTYTLTDLDFENNLASFFDGINYAEATIQKFDKVKLVKTDVNTLVLSLNGVESQIPLTSDFKFLAVYDHSLNNEEYENIVYDVATVYVLPDINANVTGGYMDINTGAVDFQPLDDDNIVIVPNNTHMIQYLLKIEMENSIAEAPLKMNKYQSNNYVDIDFYDYVADEQEDKTVYYLKISQNAQTQANTDLYFEIFYDIAQGIEDESVNVVKQYSIEIQIAPTALTVNGTSEPERLILYNYYRYPEFGWNDLYLDVISGYSSSPNYEGVYFTFDQTYLDIMYNGITINSGNERLFTDLNIPFKIRGKLGITQISNLVVTVHLKSDILQDADELTVDINCSIIAGATSVLVDENYNGSYFYLDYSGGKQNFDLQIYADHSFQYSTYTFLSGVDVLDIDTNDDNPYTEVGDRYYINLSLTPKLTGIGLYRVYLDNGMPIELTFNVVKTLSSDTTSIQLTNSGNEAVTEAYYSVEDGADFDNTLNIEILNPSTKSDISFGNVAQFTITANVNSDGIKYVPNENGYVAISKVNDYYRISTLDNGMTKITFTLSGFEIEDFRTRAKEIKLYVNVSSYSLIDEFYMRNGDDYALNNTVYYVIGGGNLQKENESVTLTPVANYSDSMNFYQYFYSQEAFVDIFENAKKNNNVETEELYDYVLSSDQIYTEIVYEKYSRKFIYFYAQYIYSYNGNSSYSTAITTTEVKVTKTYVENGQVKTEIKNIILQLESGLIFSASDFEYIDRNEIGDVLATYTVEFSNVYSVGLNGNFDVDSFTYTNSLPSEYSISLSANLRQRNSTMKYDCKIQTSLYQSVEGISLTTSLSQLNFSNSNLNYSLGVYTYPTTSTNKSVRVEFIRTNGNPYVNMVEWEIENTDSENGVYTINLSCEDFFNENRNNIVNIEDYLTGRIYIYPSEWGDSYTSIDASLQPIVIDVQYRNGSKANPYLLETAEDIVNINANETTLKSHYEISTVIDMSAVKNFVPIGILNVNGKNVLYGFSGSIIGTNSQAAITNIAVSENNFSAKVEKETVSGNFDILYAGLFAQINSSYKLDEDDPLSEVITPKIENVSFSGKFELNANSRAYVSLLTAVNRGELVNVGVKINESNINMNLKDSALYYGAVAAVNYGNIIQDFTKYDGTGYNYKVYNDSQIYVDGNGNDYILDDSNTKVYVDKEKYAIDENGNRIKYDEDGNVLLSSRDYTGQNTKNLAYYYGFVNINSVPSEIYAGGIVGASSGVVERVSSSLLKLYGYSAYSAYTLISVTEKNNSVDYHYAYVGGAVGVATYNAGTSSISGYLIDLDTPRSGNTISNLLVGGEINTSTLSNHIDAAGGIVGFVDTLEVATIDVINNTSRVFVRAKEYAGGIAGYDTYAEDYGNYTNFGTGNVIEAVDDGRNNFYASMIIKYKTLENLPADTTIAKNSFFAVGNSTRNGRSYATFNFAVYTYLKRNYTQVDKDDLVSTNSSSVTNYYGDYIILNISNNEVHINNSYTFEFKEVNLNLEESEYAMTQNGKDNIDVSVYFLYYFSVQGRLNEDGYAGAQDEIEDLNFITPNSDFYPFSLGSQDVNISSTNSNILSVDVNGNLTVKGTGLATITLTSILNVVQSRVIYIYIVNYFDKDVSSSIFYTSGNVNGVSISDESNLYIYGNSSSNIYTVPTYNLSDGKTYNGDSFTVTKDGVLNYKNVSYNLTKNTQVAVSSVDKTEYIKTSDTSIVDGKEYFVYDEETGVYTLVAEPVVEDIGNYYEQQYYSSVQINKQTIVFFKDKTKYPADGDIDEYTMTPMLKVVIQVGDEKYEFYYELENSTINFNVVYKETATSIRTNSKFYSMQTNNTFKDTITVVSTNKNEMVFYDIFYNGVSVQNRLPNDLTQFDTASNREEAWLNYMNTMNNQKDLFDIQFSRVGENVFEFNCQINVNSDKFLNRFEEDIYGEYTVYLYCNELTEGVSYSFKLILDEAEINYISINNYSNYKDVSVSDEVVVPSQRGMLEISIDPVEAVFEEFSIKNNAINYNDGATEAIFTFAYEKINENASKEYVLLQTFGRFVDGTFSFTYKEMTDLFASLNAQFEDENASVNYTGKVYISYYMPSNNVDDSADVGFDVSVTYGNEGQYSMDSTILLKTKLGSYAKLTFADKEDLGGVYYVARGLSYNLNLSYYGFSEDQITITSTNDFVADVSNVGGNYVLNVTSESINYSNDIGYKIEINTVASKVVDNVLITTTDTLTLYVMEYVLNYVYVDGVYEDIVKGMEDGIISDAIGNPYTLEFAIRDFMEYDSSNAVVNKEVEDFISEMTQNIKWTVYLNDNPTELAQNKTIRTDYYSINSYVVTPLRIYDAESDIYHFSASANYSMRNGLYYYSDVSTNSNPIYTEFSFDVHQQSTEDSPIPIENYEEFIDMQDGEWYILLNDITLPGNESAAVSGIEQFSPITANIAGLDGNGYALEMAGTYSYDTISDFGVFASVSENTVLQNVTVTLTNDVVIKLSSSTFNVGLLASTNNGIITNCLVDSSTGSEGLSVVCLTTAQNSYVAGLVSNNTGHITNSRSKINIFANVNLAGFVGQNSGIISSSYYSSSTLKNQTNTTSEYTAGFVVLNSGEIHTSYVSGEMTSNLMFYYGEENSIQSNNNITGFVYTNNGSVEDCYSNITLRQSGAFASGFVFENTGNIARCFSTSVLESEQTSNYGFARYNSDEKAVIEDCYYLSQSNVRVSDSQTVDINVSIGEIVLDEKTDISPLNTYQFGKGGLEEFFSSYVVAEGRDISSVWFYNENASDLSNFNGSVFNTGRLELVAPNIVAFSQRELDRIETVVDSATGATSAKYIYTYTSNSNPLGSVYNPILISDAETMENYILQENNTANYNYSYYRLISDIDYSEYLYNSKLYTTKFMGYIEGNFMSVSGMALVSSEAMTSAGMFAELGSSSILDAVGTIMNFDFNPQSISFANTDVVGALVGKVDNGKIYNVNLTKNNTQQTIVNGKNIVGGAVGLAIGKYDIQNLYSQYSAKARYQSASNNFNSNVVVYSSYSFAGSLIGVVSGTGRVYNSVTDIAVSVLADKAGLLFGLIDQNANVEKVYLQMQSGMIVNAYSYGGLVVGESKGIVEDVTVVGLAGSENFEGFKKVPSMPTALGGYAGLISGGIISDVDISQSISVSNQSASDGVKYIGGLGGMVTGATEISNVTINANLTGFMYVGGLIGYLNVPSNTVYFTDINVSSNMYVYGHRLVEAGIGGLVGYVGENSIVSLDSSAVDDKGDTFNTNTFKVSANSTVYLYGSNIEIYAGGIVGVNKSNLSHSVLNTDIYLTGYNQAFDMSQTYTNKALSAVVEKDGNTGVVDLQIDKVENGDEVYQTILATSLTSTNTKYYCNISFETADPTEKSGSSSYLRLNLYGKVCMPEDLSI